MASLEEIAQKKFRTDCSTIVLTRSGLRPIRWEGPGELKQDERGSLIFELRADKPTYQAAIKECNQPVLVGEIIPETEYFNIHIEEIGRGAWRGMVPVVQHRGNLFSDGFIVGHPRELVREEAIPVRPEQLDYVTVYLEVAPV